ncbi:WD40 repeat-like protein [Serendipita vermifera]|nr:WD40 repeat-like protein [Serendipita vermifera]
MSSSSQHRSIQLLEAALKGLRLVQRTTENVTLLDPLKIPANTATTILERIRDAKSSEDDWANLDTALSKQIKTLQGILERCPGPHSTALLKMIMSYETKLQNVLSSVRRASLDERSPDSRGGIDDIERLTKEMTKYSEDFMLEMHARTHEKVHRIEESVNFIKEYADDKVTRLKIVEGIIGEHHSTCLPNTRVKILDTIRKWADDPSSSQVWWLTDAAGAGKSTIAKHLSDEWRRKGMLGGCFFFDKNFPEKRETRRFCETMAYQLATSHPALRPSILRGINELRSDPSFSAFVDKLQRMVIEPVEGFDLILVIDALDECDQKDREDLLRDLLPLIPRASRMKLLVTSRPESDLKEYLERYRSKTESLHNIDLQSNRNDISLFVGDQLSSLVLSSTLTQHDVQLLSQRVNCLFILASTACSAIKKDVDPRATLEMLLTSKSNPLSGINGLYRKILEKACENPEVRRDMSTQAEITLKVLKVILAASSPLTISTIDSILDCGTTKRVIELLSSVLSVKEDGSVHMLHPTFREFLEDEDVSGTVYVDIGDAHRIMAKGCLAIMQAQLQFNICRLESSFSFNRDVPDFKDRRSKYISQELQYGCMHWMEHVISRDHHTHGDEVVNSAIAKIIDGVYPLYWMEVLSALEGVPKAVSDLQDLKNGALKSPIKERLSDIRRFLVAFSVPISESIPHIYISALPFTPIQSSTRQLAQKIFPNTLSLVVGSLKKWKELQSEWRGHTGKIKSVAFSSNNRRIVSGSADNTILLWDAETGEPLAKPMKGHTSSVTSVAFSADDHYIVSGSADETIRIWDAKTGQPLGEPLQGHTNWVRSVAFSPDGCRIVSGSADKTLRLWDAKTGQLWGEPIQGHTALVTSVAFSPDSRQIVSASEDKTIRLWNAENGQSLGEPLQGHTSGVTSVAFSSDSKLVVSGSNDKTIQVWDAQTRQPRGSPLRGHTDWVTAVAFSPDNRQIVSGSDDNTIRVWNAETGHPLGAPLKGHTDWVKSVAFSLDGCHILSGSHDQTVRLWDARTGQPLGEALRGSNSHILSGSTETAQIWDAETIQPLGEQARENFNGFMCFSLSSDNCRIVSDSFNRTIRIWDAKTGQPLGEPLRGHTGVVSSVAFSPDNCHIVSGSYDQTIRIWDAKTGQQLGKPLQGHTGRVTSVAFSPDNCHIVSGSDDRTIRIWDAKTGQSLGEPIQGHTDLVTSVAFSPDNCHIVSGSYDQTIRIWDAKTGQPLGKPLKGHSGSVRSVAFSPDNCHIISGSYDQTIRIWNAKTGQPLRNPLQGHTSCVTSVAFSPDNCHIVSGSYDPTIRIWDAKTGQQLGKPLQGHTGRVTSVAFSSDNRHIVSCSYDETIRVWPIGTSKPFLEELEDQPTLIKLASFPNHNSLGMLGSQQGVTGSLPCPVGIVSLFI